MRFLTLAIVIALVACIGGASAACNPGLDKDHWMVAHSAVNFNQLVLLGSHDAGCLQTEGHSHPLGGAWSWAVTQTLNLEQQLCAGYRVFDIRFEKAGTSHNDWRIFHGSYHFANAATVAGHFTAWCNAANRKFDTAILRIKTAGATVAEEVAFLKAFNTMLGNCGIASHGGANVFATQTPTALSAFRVGHGAGVDTATVIIMPYSPDSKGFFGLGKSAGAETIATDAAWSNIRFPYSLNQKGKSSESLKMHKVVKGQYKKMTTIWQPNGLFGFWMTMTGGVGALNVDANSAKLFDTGSYAGWAGSFIKDMVTKAPPQNLKGLTLWTDFAGDARLLSVRTAVQTLNANILGNLALDTNINRGAHHAAAPPAGKGPLVYTLLETAVSSGARVSRVASKLAAAVRTRARVPVLVGDKCPDTTITDTSDAADVVEYVLEKPLDKNCLQERMIPMDLFDDCDDSNDNLKAIMKDAAKGYCVLCGAHETKPRLEISECDGDDEKAANAVSDWKLKLTCCEVPK